MKRGLGSSSHDAEQKRARADAGLDGDAKLLRQLEYYFSDASFGFDEHLQSAADASGAVAASVLATFPRVLALTEAVAAADRPAEPVDPTGAPYTDVHDDAGPVTHGRSSKGR